MKYRRLGRAGIKVSELSFGSWITFGNQVDVPMARCLMQAAFEQGVNFFDNAEAYAAGEAERIMGEALKDLPREKLVLSTKLFWGGDGPNDRGLSRKHIFEGCHRSLKRMQLDYVDLLFCHRPDPETPIEETVRAMDQLIVQGKILYWGTSEWSATQLLEAHRIAREIHCTPPSMEQPQYHLFHRTRVEQEYQPLYKEYGMGTTTWSPLASGLLTGKYCDGIPEGSRLDRVAWLQQILTSQRLGAVRALSAVAGDLECSMTQLALAWCLKNPDVSTVILGASSLAQLEENLGSRRVVERLTEEVMGRIAGIVEQVPESTG